MADYFTGEQLKLLNKWKKQKYDKSNPEQNRVYEELKAAYETTEIWARAVQEKLFPDGSVDVRKRPTNQGNHFPGYTWAKIYPYAQAPKELAYTLGVDGEHGFIAKIDTVGLDDTNSTRFAYLKLRGGFDNKSPFVATIPVSEGLAMNMEQLVDWSINAIRGFRMSYEQVANQLKLTPASKPEFGSENGDQHPVTVHQPINRIYYGPPGTGKTYTLTELLRKDYEQSTSTISPDEWRKQFIVERIATLTWWEGAAAALYDLGGKAKVGELFEHEFIKAIINTKGRTQHVRQTLWGTLQHHTVLDSTTVNIKLRLAPAVFNKTADSVWQFAGDWQDACADILDLVHQVNAGPRKDNTAQKRYSFVTFHQSYGYEEFVEGLRPLLTDEAESGEVRYEIREGVFKKLCREARETPDKRFAMVIDEINRGNISKIFGELITLIEADKREGAKHEVSVILPYSGKPFTIPQNVDIIGTMNTADRSLALLDTALRRRFEFVPVMPNASDSYGAPLHNLTITINDQKIEIAELLSAINQRIEALYDRDHTIGHAYFTPLHDCSDDSARMRLLADIFRNRMLPLLEEYFFEDWEKIRLVLADNQKMEQDCFICKQNQEEDLTSLFGTDHNLSSYSTKPRYFIQESAFLTPSAYVGIYQTLQPGTV